MSTKPVKFERVSAVVRLGDNNNMQIPVHRGAPFVTPAEYLLLENIHGEGTVKITGTGAKPEKDAEPIESPQMVDNHRGERDRLSLLYDKASNVKDNRMPVDRLFPGTGPMPVTFSEIGVDVGKVQASMSEMEAKDARIKQLEAQLEKAKVANTEADDLLGESKK